jgi:hypothetical protein
MMTGTGSSDAQPAAAEPQARTTFRDAEGRAWLLALTVGDLKRLRKDLGVDLLDAARGDLLSRLADDPVLLADVLAVLLAPDLAAKDLAPDVFKAALRGPVFDDAGACLVRALLDFFPLSQRAAALGKMQAEILRRETILREAEASLTTLSPTPIPPTPAPETSPSAVPETPPSAGPGETSGGSPAS